MSGIGAFRTEKPKPLYKPKDIKQVLNEKRFVESKLSRAQSNGDIEEIGKLKDELAIINDVVGASDQAKAQEFRDDFTQWLTGNGKEVDHLRTPWYRTPLHYNVPSITKYIEGFVDEHINLLTKLAKVELKGPADLNSAYEYFKYIVRGRESGITDALDEYAMRWDNMIDVNKVGRETAKKLDAYFFDTKPIIPENYRAISTDFRKYLKYKATLLAGGDMVDFELERETEEKLISVIMEFGGTYEENELNRELLKEYYDLTKDGDLVMKQGLKILSRHTNQFRSIAARQINRKANGESTKDLDKESAELKKKTDELRILLEATIGNKMPRNDPAEIKRDELSSTNHRIDVATEALEELVGIAKQMVISGIAIPEQLLELSMQQWEEIKRGIALKQYVEEVLIQ
jgi:hypothetical protein